MWKGSSGSGSGSGRTSLFDPRRGHRHSQQRKGDVAAARPNQESYPSHSTSTSSSFGNSSTIRNPLRAPTPAAVATSTTTSTSSTNTSFSRLLDQYVQEEDDVSSRQQVCQEQAVVQSPTWSGEELQLDDFGKCLSSLGLASLNVFVAVIVFIMDTADFVRLEILRCWLTVIMRLGAPGAESFSL